MGGCTSRSAVAPDKEATLLMLGLDNSGKTTILANLSGEPTEGTTPSVGFSSMKMDLGGFRVTFYDVGGSGRLQNIWKNYYSEVSGSIFVVDASDHSRLTEAKEALNRVTEHDLMRGKPLLIFANKQDCEGAVNEEQLSMLLVPVDPDLSRVVKCVALKGSTGGKADLSINRGVKWLLKQIGRNLAQISERVNADVAVQKAMEIQKRKERAERVRIIKEERERQQQLAGVVEPEELVGEPLENPFKPIKQAAALTESREKAAREREKEVQERLKGLQDSDGVEFAGEIITTQAEITAGAAGETEVTTGELRHGEMEVTAGELRQPEIAGDTTEADTIEGEIAAVQAEIHGGEATLERTTDLSEPKLSGEEITGVGDDGVDGRSQSTSSGLSSSSNSLTDVTPESHSSAESLHDQAPYPPPTVGTAMETTMDNAQDQTTTTKVTGKEGKRKRRSTLLTRLKARSKTAPLLVAGDPTLPHPNPITPNAFTNQELPSPAVTTDTWTAPNLDPASAETSDRPTPKALPISGKDTQTTPASQSSPSLITKGSDNMQGLPDLPRGRVVLPPLRLTKEPIGMSDRVIHTEEDIAVIPRESIVKLSDPPPCLAIQQSIQQ